VTINLLIWHLNLTLTMGHSRSAIRLNLADMKAEAEYEVAKERCEDQTGAAQSACKKQAKEHEQASRAEIRKSAKS
jgi:hypothetical protein